MVTVGLQGSDAYDTGDVVSKPALRPLTFAAGLRFYCVVVCVFLASTCIQILRIIVRIMKWHKYKSALVDKFLDMVGKSNVSRRELL